MNLFVYGTLTFPEIVLALTGKNFEMKEAYLENYFVARLKDRPYPGLIEKQGFTAIGKLLSDVDQESLGIIRSWEDKEYTEKTINVLVNGVTISAQAFIWNIEVQSLEHWDRNMFEELHLQRFLQKEIPKYLATLKKS